MLEMETLKNSLTFLIYSLIIAAYQCVYNRRGFQSQDLSV